MGPLPYRETARAARRAMEGRAGGRLRHRLEAARQDRRGPLSDRGRRRERSSPLPRSNGSSSVASRRFRSASTTHQTGCWFPRNCTDERARSTPCSPPSIASWRRRAGAGARLRIFRNRQIVRRQRAPQGARSAARHSCDRANSTSTSATSPMPRWRKPFRALVRRLLSKSEDELQSWRDRLREALDPNGLLIVDLVPELKLIIGEQPPVPDLPPQDAQSRFQLVFRRFIGVFARPEHPLALFLDDLQWLDAATLDLLEDLIDPAGCAAPAVDRGLSRQRGRRHPSADAQAGSDPRGRSGGPGHRARAARPCGSGTAHRRFAPLRAGARRSAGATGAREDGRQSILRDSVSSRARRRGAAHFRS